MWSEARETRGVRDWDERRYESDLQRNDSRGVMNSSRVRSRGESGGESSCEVTMSFGGMGVCSIHRQTRRTPSSSLRKAPLCISPYFPTTTLPTLNLLPHRSALSDTQQRAATKSVILAVLDASK